MTNTEREFLFTPSTANGVQVTGADSTRQNLDINIVVTERFWLVFVLVELGPFGWVFDLEARESLRIGHFEFMICELALKFSAG